MQFEIHIRFFDLISQSHAIHYFITYSFNIWINPNHGSNNLKIQVYSDLYFQDCHILYIK